MDSIYMIHDKDNSTEFENFFQKREDKKVFNTFEYDLKTDYADKLKIQ